MERYFILDIYVNVGIIILFLSFKSFFKIWLNLRYVFTGINEKVCFEFFIFINNYFKWFSLDVIDFFILLVIIFIIFIV